ncbi:hypothetical protein FB446DRAFT_794069 [Lentinula raphanica]|nr:hypothetical protein FB446DRAFT_794069 [Lentinula raphanica]
MARRPPNVLQSLYTSRRARPTSGADGPGFLYAFVDHGHRWKIGMSSNFSRRRPLREDGEPNHWCIFYWNSIAPTDLEAIALDNMTLDVKGMGAAREGSGDVADGRIHIRSTAEDPIGKTVELQRSNAMCAMLTLAFTAVVVDGCKF